MKTIPLTRGKVAIVGPQDYAYLLKWEWFYATNGYAARSTPRPNQQTIYMHRVVAKRKGLTGEVDHRNRNKLDNRRGNLRLASHSQNQWNRDKQRNNTSGLKNVSFDKSTGKFEARVKRHGKQVWLGRHKTRHEAFEAVCNFITNHDGEFAFNYLQTMKRLRGE